MFDTRNFAKWRVGEDWNVEKRGPCPLTEYPLFAMNIYNFLNKNSKVKDHPLYLILMNQKYFNGIGNYLRAEILFELNINPFMPLSGLNDEQLNNLIWLCNKIKL